MVHVVHGDETEERLVEVGLDNNVMIRIASNLEAGERVLLAPPEATMTTNEDSFAEDFIEPGAPPEVGHKVVEVLAPSTLKGKDLKTFVLKGKK